MSEPTAKKGHPKGLYILFSTEAAERFSFYTMRALLVLYLTVIFVGQYTNSTVKGDEIQADIQADIPAVLTSALEGLTKEQKSSLDAAVQAIGTDPAAVWSKEAATDLSGLVDSSMSDLKTDLDAMFTSSIAQIGTDPKPFAQWVVKEKIRSVIRTEALSLYGLYLLLVYTSGLVGGYFADKILGSRKAILMGGIVMCLGLLTMSIPGATSLYYGLGLIIAGNGFFKPNISTIVSGLYEEQDPRRDGAFTIFYMGINLGAFIAVFGAGVAESMAKTYEWGWNIGFAIAAVGMILSLGLFLWGQKYLGKAGFPPGVEITPTTRLVGRDYRDVAVWALGTTGVVLAAVTAWNWVGPVWRSLPTVAQILVGGAIIVAALWGAFFRKNKKDEPSQSLTAEEWQRVAVIVILSLFVIFFWMGFEQAGGTMNLFAFEQTDRHIGSWEMPATWFQGFNPMFIFALAPLFSAIWNWNDRQKWGLSTPAKMGVGLLLLGAGFGIMYLGQGAADEHGKAALWWLVAVYFVHTIAELCLSPIGLSMVTKLSPVRIVSLMMGVWFFCTAMADYLSGRMEAITHALDLGLWSTLIGTSVVPGIILIALAPLLSKWMHGKA